MIENTTIICKTFKEFYTFVNEHKTANLEVAYDVETNARNTHSKDHRVIGFSISYDKYIGCYVPLKALDYEFSAMDKRLVEKHLKEILKQNKTLVYNCTHEYIATESWLGLEIPNIEDLYVLVKLMMGKAKDYEGKTGLKLQSVLHLGYDNWSDDLQVYFKYLKDLPKYKSQMKKLLLKYYSESEIPDLFALMNNIPEEELNRDVISYEYVPYKVIGDYGSLDSTVLFDLRDFYYDWINRENESLGINLYKCFDYWQKHHYAGYIIERNGAYWDDTKATEVEEWCVKGVIEAHQNLLRSPLSRPQYEEYLETQYLMYLLKEHTDILTPEYIPLKVSKASVDVSCVTESAEKLLRSMSLVPKITKKLPNGKWHLALGNFKTIVERKRSSGQFDDSALKEKFYTDYLNEVIDSGDRVRMKELFNPNQVSPVYYKFLNSVLITDDIKLAHIFNELHALTEDPEFDLDYYRDFYDMSAEMVNNYPKYSANFNMSKFKKENIQYTYQDNADSKLLDFVHKIKGANVKNKFRLFKKQLQALQSDLSNRKVCSIIYKASNLTFDKFNDDNVISIYNLYEFTGIDIDDPSTWNENFKWLYYYRWYKKYGKILSTYIYGTVGRSSVWYVPKADFESGEAFTKRSIPYYKDADNRIPNVVDDPENYDLVLQTDFKVNEADSGRWKATLHTIPSGSTIKGILRSRYKGGIIAMPDCSQAEVRVLARASNEDNLLKAFMEGLDIHRFVASLVYKKDMKEITSRERKVAKSAVFGLLYGETEQAFADEHFGGDINKALEVYSYFYQAFPKVKDFIDTCHKNYDEFKKAVLYITDRYIDMSRIKQDARDKSKIYRQSQNFPIQGSCCDIAGLILYYICKYIAENGLRSKPICFIHDSIEIDIPPEETFLMLDKLKPLFNDYPYQEFGVPMASDIVFSCNMGSEIEIEEMEHNEDYTDIQITLNGIEDDIDEVIDTWKSVYTLVEQDQSYEGPIEDVYIPLKGLFQKKAVISKDMGTYKHKVSRKYHVITKERK